MLDVNEVNVIRLVMCGVLHFFDNLGLPFESAVGGFSKSLICI